MFKTLQVQPIYQHWLQETAFHHTLVFAVLFRIFYFESMLPQFLYERAEEQFILVKGCVERRVATIPDPSDGLSLEIINDAV